jgi:GT2 family glycosyltransferase
MRLSVIVPTCRRTDLLDRCLGSLAPGVQAGFPAPDYEVIVSDDDRAGSAREMIRASHPWAAWTAGPGRGPAANRNHGARQASGEWLAFIDDDCVADPGWLGAVAREAAGGPLDVVEGRTIIPDPKDNPFLHAVENTGGDCYWSCNLAVRRDAFWRIGGFDEEFLAAGGEDMEFAWRLKRGRLSARFCPGAVVKHPQRPYSARAFLRRIWEAKWILLYRQKTGGAMPDSAGTVAIAIAVVRMRLFTVLRGSVLAWRGVNRGNWRTTLFGFAWSWITLPIQLPHMVWWEFRFRRQRTPR